MRERRSELSNQRLLIHVVTPLLAGILVGAVVAVYTLDPGQLVWAVFAWLGLSVVHVLAELIMYAVGAATRARGRRQALPQKLRWLIRLISWTAVSFVAGPVVVGVLAYPLGPTGFDPVVGLLASALATPTLAVSYCLACGVVLSSADRRSSTASTETA